MFDVMKHVYYYLEITRLAEVRKGDLYVSLDECLQIMQWENLTDSNDSIRCQDQKVD